MTLEAALEERRAGGATSGLEGRLRVELSPGPRSVVARTARSAALELRGPFPGSRGERFFLRNVTAGVFGGDRYEVAVHAAPGVSASIAPTAATRVYASQGALAESRVRIRVEPGARLDYDGGALILQAHAQLRQEATLVVPPGAALAYRETVVFGRLASGEYLDATRYAGALRLGPSDEVPCFEERCDLYPAIDRALIHAALGGYGVLGTLLLAGLPAPEMVPEVTGTYAGLSTLPNGAGTLLRVLGRRVEDVQACLAQAFDLSATGTVPPS